MPASSRAAVPGSFPLLDGSFELEISPDDNISTATHSSPKHHRTSSLLDSPGSNTGSAASSLNGSTAKAQLPQGMAMTIELPDFACMLPSECSFSESATDDAAAPTPHTPVVLSVFEGEGLKAASARGVAHAASSCSHAETDEFDSAMLELLPHAGSTSHGSHSHHGVHPTEHHLLQQQEEGWMPAQFTSLLNRRTLSAVMEAENEGQDEEQQPGQQQQTEQQQQQQNTPQQDLLPESHLALQQQQQQQQQLESVQGVQEGEQQQQLIELQQEQSALQPTGQQLGQPPYCSGLGTASAAVQETTGCVSCWSAGDGAAGGTVGAVIRDGIASAAADAAVAGSGAVGIDSAACAVGEPAVDESGVELEMSSSSTLDDAAVPPQMQEQQQQQRQQQGPGSLEQHQQHQNQQQQEQQADRPEQQSQQQVGAPAIHAAAAAATASPSHSVDSVGSLELTAAVELKIGPKPGLQDKAAAAPPLSIIVMECLGTDGGSDPSAAAADEAAATAAAAGVSGVASAGQQEDEWELANRRVQELQQQQQLASHTPSAAAAAGEGRTSSAGLFLSYQDAESQLLATDMRSYRGQVLQSLPHQPGWLARHLQQLLACGVCSAGPGLVLAEGSPEQEEVVLLLSLAKTGLNDASEVHLRILQAVYRAFTGKPGPVPRFGGHWCDVGFQGDDPATDLRGVGMLGLLQLLYLTHHNTAAAQKLFQLSISVQQEFPLAAVSLNITRWTLTALRAGALTRPALRLGGYLAAANRFYCGAFYEFHARWCQGKTMREAGYVLKQLEEHCRRHPARLLQLAAAPDKAMAAADKHAWQPSSSNNC